MNGQILIFIPSLSWFWFVWQKLDLWSRVLQTPHATPADLLLDPPALTTVLRFQASAVRPAC